MYWLGGFLVVVFVIPNTTNFKERRAFSDNRRLSEAMAIYNIKTVDDMVTVVPGAYYRRNKVGQIFLGEKQRDLWTTPVTVKVFNYDTYLGGMKPLEVGGGQQTISIKLEDAQKRKWSLRSVNKDQKSALPGFFRITFMRFLIRDQLASANPYGHLVIPVLADAIGIHHTTPQLVFVPYDERHGDFNQRMAGRLAYLEEDLNSSWKNRERFGSPKDIMNTEEMLEMQKETPAPVDTLLYLKTRIFDMLISDWDRHEGNWEWALTKNEDGRIFEPIPKDRDNAFYQFDEGLVSHITLLFTSKLQSFRKEFGKIDGLMVQSREMDMKILSRLDKKEFLDAASHIQKSLGEEVIRSAFKKYPARAYEKAGLEHEEIFKARLKQLPEVASQFHDLLHGKKK